VALLNTSNYTLQNTKDNSTNIKGGPWRCTTRPWAFVRTVKGENLSHKLTPLFCSDRPSTNRSMLLLKPWEEYGEHRAATLNA